MSKASTSASDYSPLFTSGLYYPNASRRQAANNYGRTTGGSFLDVDSPSESGDDADSMGSFVGVLRPHNPRSASPTPTLRPAAPHPQSRPYPSSHRTVPPAPPAPSSALPSLPPNSSRPYPPQYPSPSSSLAPPPQRPSHARTHTSSSSSTLSPAAARSNALARLEGRPTPAQAPRKAQAPMPSSSSQSGSFLPLPGTLPSPSSRSFRAPIAKASSPSRA